MNNPEDIVVDVDEQVQWLNAHKDTTGYSWSVLAAKSGIPKGTLSQIATGGYAGSKQNAAERIYRYRQLVESQAERAIVLPEAPKYIDTPTSRRIRSLLISAQRGRITVAGTGPGTGKTLTMREYQASVANVWVATMEPTTRSLATMISAVMKAVGGVHSRGYGSQMSALVRDAVAGRGGLLVIDEANHCDLDSLEQLRAWHDATGVGICLLGNEELITRIRSGSSRHAFGRLNSRINMSHVQDLPLADDIDAYLDAWNIEDAAMRKMLHTIGLTPGAGGLREISQIIENASILACEDEQPLSLGHLREATSTRSTRYIRITS